MNFGSAAREAAVRAVHDVLPHPADPHSAHQMSEALLHPELLALTRQRLARALHTLRVASAAVVDGIARWRREMRLRAKYYATLPLHELKFLYRGADYSVTMLSDMAFLPAPVKLDPLLLDWFGEAIPWMAAAEERLRNAMMGIAAVDEANGSAETQQSSAVNGEEGTATAPEASKGGDAALFEYGVD